MKLAYKNKAASKKVAITKSSPSRNNARPAKVLSSKKVPSKEVATWKAAAKKEAPGKDASMNQAPQVLEPQNPMQEMNSLQREWERDLAALAKLTESYLARGGLDQSDDRGEVIEFAERCGVLSRQSETLIEWHKAFIKAIKARPDASNLTFAIDGHKKAIALMRETARNVRAREKEVRKLLTIIKH